MQVEKPTSKARNPSSTDTCTFAAAPAALSVAAMGSQGPSRVAATYGRFSRNCSITTYIPNRAPVAVGRAASRVRLLDTKAPTDPRTASGNGLRRSAD